MINVIVRPDVYERHRVAVRGEPFLHVTGKLRKDGETVNVLAEEVEGLRLGTGRTSQPRGTAPTARGSQSPWDFLRAMRGAAPDSKDWG